MSQTSCCMAKVPDEEGANTHVNCHGSPRAVHSISLEKIPLGVFPNEGVSWTDSFNFPALLSPALGEGSYSRCLFCTCSRLWAVVPSVLLTSECSSPSVFKSFASGSLHLCDVFFQGFFESQEEKGINGAAIPVVLNPLPLFLTCLENLASGVSTWHLKLNMPRVKQL